MHVGFFGGAVAFFGVAAKVEETLEAQEQGRSAQLKLEADAYYIQRQKEAEALLAEKRAKAEAITRLNEALSGSGGRTMVKRKVAESLKGKKIVVLPGGDGAVGLQKLDVNSLVNAFVATEAAQPAPAPSKKP